MTTKPSGLANAASMVSKAASTPTSQVAVGMDQEENLNTRSRDAAYAKRLDRSKAMQKAKRQDPGVGQVWNASLQILDSLRSRVMIQYPGASLGQLNLNQWLSLPLANCIAGYGLHPCGKILVRKFASSWSP